MKKVTSVLFGLFLLLFLPEINVQTDSASKILVTFSPVHSLRADDTESGQGDDEYSESEEGDTSGEYSENESDDDQYSGNTEEESSDEYAESESSDDEYSENDDDYNDDEDGDDDE